MHEDLILPSLSSQFSKIGIQLSDHQLRQFSIYYREIISWNRRINLISKKDECRIIERHFLESSALSHFDVFEKEYSVLDLGSGGGFPGMPLKIVRPDLDMTLLDSNRMKVLFLKRLVEKLTIENVEILWTRATETEVKAPYQNHFDIVISRAVARLTQLYRWAQPFVKSEGVILAIKGSKLDEEVQDLKLEHSSLTVQIKPFPWRIPGKASKQRVVFVYPAINS